MLKKKLNELPQNNSKNKTIPKIAAMESYLSSWKQHKIDFGFSLLKINQDLFHKIFQTFVFIKLIN